MKSNLPTLANIVQNYLKKLAIGFVILTLAWHGAILGVDPAIASPLLATSVSSMSKQVTGKAEEMKGSATKSIGKAQSGIEDKASDAKMKVKDDLTEAKIKLEGDAARVGNAADKATEKVKNFFGQ